MKKILLKTIVAAVLFSLNIYPVHADLFDWPSPTETAGEIMDYVGIGRPGSANGLDKKEVSYMTRTFNASRQKKLPPQVMLNFNPSNPVPGEKITAVAKPLYFMSDLKKMYYTWYILHKSDNKDLNNDGRTNIEDYKIEAARVIASNDFEWEKADYNNDPDTDGYKAIFGGEEQQGKDSKHCYIHDTDTGNEHELSNCKHLFPQSPIKYDFEGITFNSKKCVADEISKGKSRAEAKEICFEKTGNDSFGKNEEEFWRTDPANPDTAATGNTDEANVAGLGVSEFTWTYQEGDKVGVAIEGISVEPTQYKDSSYRIMWALAKNKCSLEDALETVREGTVTEVDTETSQETVIDPITGEESIQTTTIVTTVETVTTIDDAPGSSATLVITTTIVTTVTNEAGDVLSQDTDESSETRTRNLFQMEAGDINACLEDNLVDPTEGGETNKIDVQLSYLPKSPINDPTGESSDDLIINSSVTNIKDEQRLKYLWQVYTSTTANPDSWGEPLKKNTKDELPETVAATSGMGLSELMLKLAFTKDTRLTADGGNGEPKFLKIKVTVSENTSKKTTREGHTDIIVPLSSTSEKIRAYSVTASEDSESPEKNITLTMGENERCDKGMDAAICPVLKNEIIGLKMPSTNLLNFSWTINGESFVYNDPECLSGECAESTGEETDIAFFPVLKDAGEQYSISASAEKSNGEKITLTRTFEVVEPKVKILPANINEDETKMSCSSDEVSCQPKLLGFYTNPLDPDEKEWPDFSDSNFEALVGTEVQFKLKPNAGSWEDYAWFIDGEEATPDNAGLDENGVLSFLVDKNVGESYKLTAATIYTQDKVTKRALHNYWNVSLGEFYEKPVSDIIEISLVNSVYGQDGNIVRAPNSDGRILATISHNLPSYLYFLFRIVILSFLIILGSWIIFAFFPQYEK